MIVEFKDTRNVALLSMKGLMQSKLSSHIAVCSGVGWKGFEKTAKMNKSWLLDILSCYHVW